MRRILSILLVTALALMFGVEPTQLMESGLFSGWTGKADESRLQACCRKGGAHHCAMGHADSAAVSGGETHISSQGSCPYWPRALASIAPFAAGVLASRAPLASAAARLTAKIVRAQLPRGSVPQNWSERGPPDSPIL